MLLCKFVSRGYEGATVQWIEGAVTAIGHNGEVDVRESMKLTAILKQFWWPYSEALAS